MSRRLLSSRSLLAQRRTLEMVVNGAELRNIMEDFGKDGETSLTDGYLYCFGHFALDSRKRTLSRGDSPVSLTPRAFEVLLFLVQNPNRLVTKEELLQAVWGETFVEEERSRPIWSKPVSLLNELYRLTRTWQWPMLKMGRIKLQVDYDLAGANASFQRAVALEPGNPDHVSLAAFSSAYLGRFDEALQLNRQAIDLDPLNAGGWESLAETELLIGQLDRRG